MLTKRVILSFIIAIFTALAAQAQTSQAAEDVISLRSQALANAVAEATIRDIDARYDEKEVTVNAWGLQPNSVYTVWLAKEDQSDFKGLGVKNYSFETDGSGNGRFIATVSEYEFERWDFIELAYHPDGNASNLDNAVVAFRGDLEHIRR